MSLVCSISGVVPEIPVLSKTGYIFEKRLIEKHIDIHGKCPITGTELNKDDLQPIQCSKVIKPKTLTAASIPGLLSLFQNEWDALMTETYQLKVQLETVRNQLSHSLYQHDASTRVIARLLKEKDIASQRILDLQKQLSSSVRLMDIVDEEPGLSDELIAQMQDLAKQLLSTRKSRLIEGLTPVEKIKEFSNVAQYPLHSSTLPGVMCIDIDRKNGTKIASGGIDATGCYFDLNKQKTISKLHGHLKKINTIKIHNKENIILTGSDDKTIRIWKGEDSTLQFKTSHIARKHKGEVTSLSIHPLNDYFVSSAKDKSWSFFDINTGKCIQSSQNLLCNYKCISFHPDGMLLGGGGEDGNIHIWDMKGAQFKVSLSGHTDVITDLSFSENGYYLASASLDGSVKLWDLRKSIAFQTIHTADKSAANSISFDNSGQYIAIASSDISINYFETRASVASVVTLSDHTAPVTDVCFGPNSSFIVSSSLDRTVRVWEPQ